jgi:hypothetical protein
MSIHGIPITYIARSNLLKLSDTTKATLHVSGGVNTEANPFGNQIILVSAACKSESGCLVGAHTLQIVRGTGPLCGTPREIPSSSTAAVLKFSACGADSVPKNTGVFSFKFLLILP